jgi:hypothetical protein
MEERLSASITTEGREEKADVEDEKDDLDLLLDYVRRLFHLG